MRTVLLLDADVLARRRTVSAMRYGGFETKSAHGLQEARRLLRRNRYAALIVDPGTGVEAAPLVEDLRARTDVPIIAVSSCDEPPYKIALLDAGADDYVLRPFDPEELLARLRAVLRRVAPIDETGPIVTAAFTMHLADRRLFRSDDTEVTLSPTEWKLIEVLVQHQGHLVTREELLAAVWGPDAESKTQYLRVYMASIRRKLEPVPSHPLYFVTAPGLGLRFVPQSASASEHSGREGSDVFPPCQNA